MATEAITPLPLSKFARRAVDRAVDRKREHYAGEIRRLIDASFELIEQTGNLEPKVSEIVARAGLSNQAFYKHFRSKDELLLAVLDEGRQMLSGYLQHRMQKAKNPTGKIEQWVDGMTEQVLNPQAAHATRPFALSRGRLAELFPAEVVESDRQLTQMLSTAIQEAIDAGLLPADTDAGRDADIIHNLLTGWMERKLADPASVNKGDAAYLKTFIMNGLRCGA